MSGAAILAGVFVVYALVASRLEQRSITAPMVFVVAGLVLGPSVWNVLPLQLENEAVLVLTELTLAVLLFADAATVRLRDVEGDALLPGRLLVLGLPLTVALGTVAARILFPDASWAAAALLATILAPTDAALGMAVVANSAVPVRIRRALNVESGLNDGIATPFVTLFLALVASEEGVEQGSWVAHATKELGLAVVAALVVGAAGGLLLATARHRGWTTQTSEQLAVLASAILAYEGAVAIGGNGFVAAFVGGLFFGAATAGREHEAVEFTETLGAFSSFLVWAIFGALFVGPVLTNGVSYAAVLYAVVSLTVVRMVPVAAALTGTGMRRDSVAFVGWFGPRGLASVVFTLVAVETLHGSGPDVDTLVEVATWTILLSVVLHGISAGPLAGAYGRRIAGEPGNLPELMEAPEPRVRRRGVGHNERAVT